ncbi:MBL fold metallo-hydrolase [Arthrobacter sp. USHLN218]|uniref:MBL fold metallo-hydrolase n=1 Tax=Arthrobacter sp. USHLN218 TaxID=3081232 RepID=UPI0030167D9F
MQPHHSSPWSPAAAISEQTPGVFFVEGPASNWIIARDGRDFTVIDGGYPGDIGHVLASISHLGLDPAHAAAMVITHGHIDHTGSAGHFSDEYGTPVLSSSAERPQLLGEVKYQVAPLQIIIRAWRPRVLKWMIHAIQAGGTATNNIAEAEAWDAARLAALPGGLVAVPTPGHTPGHAAYRLPEAGAVATGDAFVTGHAISAHCGPQMLHPMYHHDVAGAYASLNTLAAVPENRVLPGHGPAMDLDLATAVQSLAP